MSEMALPQRVRPLRPGDPARLGAFEVIGFLGEGGMGLVYLGRSPDGALVAIKVVRAEFAREPEFRARFRREAESAMRVPRFCTAEVVAADPDAAEPYLVTEYIDGPTLDEVVKSGGPLQRAELDQLGVSVAAALTGIHGAGVTHRDLKPSNVLLSRMGPRVIDFGVAGAVDAIRLTVEGQALGTPAYMAPEQLDGRPGPASDVFAWGGVMVFAATGRRPFGTGPLPELAVRIMQAEPDLRGLTGPLRDAVAAALTKDEKRRPSAGQVLQMLGVSGTDPAVAVQTRLAGMGLPGPDAPPPAGSHGDVAAATRMDDPAEAITAAGAGPMPGTARAGAQTGEPVSMRFGPGVQPGEPDAATKMWRTGQAPEGGVKGRGRPKGHRPKGRRLWSVLSGLLSLAVFVGVAAWLITHFMPGDMEAVGVKVTAVKQRRVCGDVNLTGTVTTNGEPGRLTYQWKLSDRKRPEAAAEIQVAKGTKTTSLPFLWQFSGHGRKAKYTATLKITGAKQSELSSSATFTYACPG